MTNAPLTVSDYRIRTRLIAGKWHWELMHDGRVVSWGPSGFDEQSEAEEVGEAFRRWKLQAARRHVKRKARKKRTVLPWYTRYRTDWQDHVDRRAGT